MRKKAKLKNNVKVKIELWKEINGYINRIEEKHAFFFTVMVSFFSAVVLIFENFDTNKSNELYDIKFWTLLFTPIAISVLMAYLAYNFRWVAIARMYATSLEKSINADLGETIFTWNSDIVDQFVAKRNFANTKLLPIVNLLLFLSMGSFLIYSMWDLPTISLTFKIAYIWGIIILFVVCLLPLLGNEKIRKNEYSLKLNGEGDELGNQAINMHIEIL